MFDIGVSLDLRASVTRAGLIQSEGGHGFEPLGPADGPVKTAILGGNNARLYKYRIVQTSELAHDRFAQLRDQYAQAGGSRSNLPYGYIRQRLA